MPGKLGYVIFLLLVSSLVSGCWDNWEIEERGLVLGLGLDLASGEARDFPGLEGSISQAEDESRFYALTFQLPIPAAFGGGNGGGGEQEAFWNLTSSFPGSAEEIRGLAATRSSRKLYFEHLQVMVIGQELARQGFYPVLDRFLRDREARRQVQVYITEGLARDVLAVKPKDERINATYLSAMVQNADVACRIAPAMDLGLISRKIHENGAYVIPKVTVAGDDAKLAGGGVCKGDRLVGWLGEEETAIYRWIIDRVEGGSIIFSVEEQGMNLVDAYRPVTSSTRIRPQLHNGQLQVLVKIKSEGDLVERQETVDVLTAESLEQIRAAVEAKIEKQARLLIEKVQREFQLDIFGFGEEINRRYPKVWHEIKDRWEEEFFPFLPVEVQVKLDLRRIGVKR